MTLEGYLDNAATAVPKAPGVTEACARCLDAGAGNPGRGGHRMAVAASRIVEQARDEVAGLLGGEPERTVLGPGATFHLNAVLLSVLDGGGRVVTSSLEHNAVMRPLRHLERTRGVEIRVLSGEPGTGVPSPEEAARAVREAPTRLVVLTHASNVTGSVLPVAEIAAAVAPAPVLVDGAQSAGALPVRFADLGAAAWACSGHKGLLGPPGVGVLLLAPWFDVQPLVRGGTGSASESEEMPDTMPDRLEAGTPNVAGAAGLAAACRWIATAGIDRLHRRTTQLARESAAELASLPAVTVHGLDGRGERIGVFSFTVDGVDAGELAAWLDRENGLMVRAGLHCAPAAHRRLGTFPSGTVRVGIGPFTTEQTLQRLVEAVDRSTRLLARKTASRKAGVHTR